MKRSSGFIILGLLYWPLLCAVTAQNYNRVDIIRERLLNPLTDSVLVVAHRGDWRYAPENSLAAIENVIEMGVDIVELDVQRTKDGHLILMHDSTLNRTTTGKGRVCDYTLAEIKKLKLRNGLGIHTRHAIPTLEEALLLAKGKIMINLDKAYDFFDEVYALLEKTGTTKQIIMKGGKPVQQVKEEFGQYLDKVIYMPVINLDKSNAMQLITDYLEQLSPVAFEFSYISDLNPLPQKARKLLKGKCLIWYNTLWDTMSGGHDDDSALKNPHKEYGYLIDSLGARIIQTDTPEFLIRYLNNRGIHDISEEYLRLTSPDGKLFFILYSLDGILTYRVKYGMSDAILSSPLGLIRNDGQFVCKLQFVSKSDQLRIDEEYMLKSGKRSKCRNLANEQIVRLVNPEGKPIELIIRAYNDGVAFRYRFPVGSENEYKILEELTGFRLPLNGKAWIHPYDWNSRLKPSYETYCMNDVKVGSFSPHEQGWAYPMLFHVNDLWLMITEAALDDNYCATHIRNLNDGLYKVCFAEEEEVVFKDFPEPVSTLPWEMPWRVIAVGEQIADIVETNIVQNLNLPCALDDVDWIKPGRASWSWWSDPPSTQSYETLLSYIDFTANMGWEYMLIDAGWHKMHSKQLDCIINYANDKNVGIWLWYHSGAGRTGEELSIWNLMSDSKARKKELNRLQTLGVKGIKVDFFDTDKQPAIKLCKEILKDAAEYHLMVNFHGATLPRGWERTYPHLLTVEAVKGAECLTNQRACNMAPVHNTTLPFTRNVVGSMDYTPVTFSNRVYKGEEAINVTTQVHQLALAVLFESGIQHFADNKDIYAHLQPPIKKFLEEIPVVWDETRFVSGFPGQFVVMARRKGSKWYIGGINGLNKEKEVSLDFSFIPHNCRANLFMDSKRNNRAIVKYVKLVGQKAIMLPYGGFVCIIDLLGS